jgi:hypothetical protein
MLDAMTISCVGSFYRMATIFSVISLALILFYVGMWEAILCSSLLVLIIFAIWFVPLRYVFIDNGVELMYFNFAIWRENISTENTKVVKGIAIVNNRKINYIFKNSNEGKRVLSYIASRLTSR